MAPNYLTTAQAAREVGMSSRTLARYAANGVLVPATVLPSGHRRWDLGELRRQLDELQRRGEDGDS
ncbi:MerR family DNA-binding transcriptional regulator [Actinomycetospora chibensis]|uniref:MerR family DNA-binding transcriptional regulator n=1 Tax=Actinomycetospora chibensis TaxID=663606 RepID=A0ABV9RFK2_9PSEU|nr:MerR family DNA-binding transcriptional regulator [Actinomycetospora chibensis]MDD7925005.1 MerR family DNA-binding transcriptional regulator [Actinomycetospora chibensis]